MAFLFFCRNEKDNPEIHMKFQGTLNSQTSLETEPVGELMLPGLKLIKPPLRLFPRHIWLPSRKWSLPLCLHVLCTLDLFLIPCPVLPICMVTVHMGLFVCFYETMASVVWNAKSQYDSALSNIYPWEHHSFLLSPAFLKPNDGQMELHYWSHARVTGIAMILQKLTESQYLGGVKSWHGHFTNSLGNSRT